MLKNFFRPICDFFKRLGRYISWPFRWTWHKLKNIPYADYIFLDWKTFAIILLLFALIVLLWAPRPVQVVFPKLENQLVVIDALIKVTTILFGVTISLIVLSFNIFYKHFGRFVFQDFFRSRLIRRPFTILLCCIAFLLYSYNFLKLLSAQTVYANILFLSSIVFCTLSFFIIFPSVIFLLRQSQNRGNIRKILEGEWPLSEELRELLDEDRDDIGFKDPKVLLTEIGTVAVKEFDLTTLETIVREMVLYYKESFDLPPMKKPDQRKVYRAFTSVFKRLFNVAVKERNSDGAILISRKRFELEEFAMAHWKELRFYDHDEMYEYWDLEMDAEAYFDKAASFNEDEVCRDIIREFRFFMVSAIGQLLPIGYRHDVGGPLGGQGFQTGIKGLSRFTEQLLSYKKFHLYEGVAIAFSSVREAVRKADFDTSGKHHLLTILANTESQQFERLVKQKDVQHIQSMQIPFIAAVESADEIGFEYDFELLGKCLKVLLFHEKLNTVFLNSYRSTLQRLIRAAHTKPSLQTLAAKGIVRLRSAMRIIAVQGSDASDYRKEKYNKMWEYSNFIREEYDKEGYNMPKVKHHLDEILKDTALYLTYKNELTMAGYVYDENIV